MTRSPPAILPPGPGGRLTAARAGRRLVRSILSVERRHLEPLAALRCTLGVAIPLLLGLVLQQPLLGVFGAVGAVGVGFGSFQGAYRSRAGVMLVAAISMAFSVFVGSLTGHSAAASILVATIWAFAAGLVVALGAGPTFVGLQSIVAILVAGGFPSDVGGAVARAALVLAGGLVQTFLVMTVWPLRRFSVERRNLGAVYRTLASYASTIADPHSVAPEPHTLASTPSPFADPQPFARSHQTFIFQALLDEAERIRASLAALAVRYDGLDGKEKASATVLAALSARALAEISTALDEGRQPREASGSSPSVDGIAGRIPSGGAGERLHAQIRAAWRTAGVLSAGAPRPSGAIQPAPPPRPRPGLRDAAVTLASNLTIRSTSFRHALRLAVVLAIAAAAAQLSELPRGYWMPLTVALVLKPDFHDTFAFGIGRVGGTVLGAAGATAIAMIFVPGQIALNVLVLAFVWGCYAFASANYAAFSVCITGYVVFLMTLAGIPELAAATDRIVYTAAAGALALAAYLVWPTWSATEVRPAIATMLETQSRYVASLLSAYAAPTGPDMSRLDDMRAAARLARSNAEAVVERMLSEPRAHPAMTARTALGIVGATRRIALAALSLHAGLEHSRAPVSGVGEFTAQVESGMLALATAIRERSVPPTLPPPAAIRSAVRPALDYLFGDETDVIADSMDTIADLLAKEAGGQAAGAVPLRATRTSSA